jgi:hypothetical protein
MLLSGAKLDAGRSLHMHHFETFPVGEMLLQQRQNMILKESLARIGPLRGIDGVNDGIDIPNRCYALGVTLGSLRTTHATHGNPDTLALTSASPATLLDRLLNIIEFGGYNGIPELSNVLFVRQARIAN